MLNLAKRSFRNVLITIYILSKIIYNISNFLSLKVAQAGKLNDSSTMRFYIVTKNIIQRAH